ncbi:MAG TPA: penicillin-insensitive murein endopeptidase [Polyangiaceae bacterium]
MLASLMLLNVGCIGAPNALAPGLHGSIGMPHSGVQTEAIELPQRGDGFVRFRPHSPTYWGNPRLVGAIQDVGRTMLQKSPETAPLVVGDLSGRYGGKIPRHNSHRTGRDVDLLFYMTTPAGAPIRTPGFVPVGNDGLAEIGTEYLRFDVERNWLLLRELLTSHMIEVQWLFISRDLEAMLIDYALARETDLDLVWQAETVMLQPGDSAPHDDHVHLRIACRPDEAVYGCEGGGPRWEWQPPLPRIETPLAELLVQIAKEDPYEIQILAEAGGG